jgi:hypothetical protein
MEVPLNPRASRGARFGEDVGQVGMALDSMIWASAMWGRKMEKTVPW